MSLREPKIIERDRVNRVVRVIKMWRSRTRHYIYDIIDDVVSTLENGITFLHTTRARRDEGTMRDDRGARVRFK